MKCRRFHTCLPRCCLLNCHVVPLMSSACAPGASYRRQTRQMARTCGRSTPVRRSIRTTSNTRLLAKEHQQLNRLLTGYNVGHFTRKTGCRLCLESFGGRMSTNVLSYADVYYLPTQIIIGRLLNKTATEYMILGMGKPGTNSLQTSRR